MRASQYGAKVMLLLLLAGFVAGCASTLETRVSTFRDESAVIGGGTIKVVPEESQLTQSLEFGHYRRKLEDKLAAQGYMPIADGSARYLARLGYWVEEREVPDKGPRTSIGTSIGTVFGGRVGVGTGITLGGGSTTEIEYYRVVTITISENKPFPRDGKATSQTNHLIEVRASSAGNCADLPLVFDQMLDAVFSNFDRPSGSTETVEVPADSDC